jgi:hypothetical protein
MAERESRKRKLDPEGEQYRQGLMKSAIQADSRKKSRALGKEINTDLSDLFGKMKASDEPAVADVVMGQGRRRKSRKTRKASKKKSRKTRKH